MTATARRVAGTGIARAAVGIAVVTVLARVVGFVRGLVFVRTAGATALGDTYYAANAVPNIVFEVVAGGALASAVVPLVAGAVAAGDRDAVNRTTSALVTWLLGVLVPLAVLGAALAHPIMRLLTGGGAAQRPDSLAVGARMLLVFMPQIPLYGVGIALTGVLQAHRRFLGPALAPLLSSVVVIAAYATFAVEPGSAVLTSLSPLREYTLSIGTTLGVVALTLPLLIPLRRAGVRLRPTLAFPPGVARRLVVLAASGFAALAAQQLATAVVLRLSYDGPAGTYVLYNLAWTLFLLPWAVLAVPVATSAFPALAAHAETADLQSFQRLTARTTRAIVLLTGVAVACLIACAQPVARVLVLNATGHPDPRRLAAAVVAFAPGLVGYGLIALLARALFAVHGGRAAGVATVSGWVAVVVADIALVRLAPAGQRLAALGAGNSIGMTIAGLLLVIAVRRASGAAAHAGLGRSLVAAGAGAVAGGVLGAVVAAGLVQPLGDRAVAANIVTGVAAAAAAVLAFLVVAVVIDRREVLVALRSLRPARRPSRTTAEVG